MQASTLEAAAHVVQLALTPVFLLSGIATLLNVFATRFGRVADQVEAVSDGELGDLSRMARLQVLRWRSRILDFAVVVTALAGALTCGAVLDLFLGEVRGAGAAAMLFLLFGGAIILTMLALSAFALEMLLGSYVLRRIASHATALDGRASSRGSSPPDRA